MSFGRERFIDRMERAASKSVELQDELLGMIRRDFTPKPPTLELQLQRDEEEIDELAGHTCTSDCRRIGCEDVEARQRRAEFRADYDSDVADYDLEEIICADERDDDIESREELPGH
jgi:hypothetical protein